MSAGDDTLAYARTPYLSTPFSAVAGMLDTWAPEACGFLSSCHHSDPSHIPISPAAATAGTWAPGACGSTPVTGAYASGHTYARRIGSPSPRKLARDGIQDENRTCFGDQARQVYVNIFSD